MKRILILLLAAVLVCVMFTGCNAKTPPATNGAPTPATSGEQIPVQSENPKPIYGKQIKDGTYKIEVSSSSSMFRIVDAQLTVVGGEMSAVLTLSGDGYEKLYMGTGEQALTDSEDKYIYFVENVDGKYTYKVPVSVLNQETDCAAWSIRKQQWYDRILVFQSSLIPEDAISVGPTAQLPEDGQYTIEVTLSGGSGKATVESPAKLVVADGVATATIIWSSPNYDYMLVNGNKYNPVNTEGNSTFEIPVALDMDMSVTADTVAMSTSHEIDYTLCCDSATLKK